MTRRLLAVIAIITASITVIPLDAPAQITTADRITDCLAEDCQSLTISVLGPIPPEIFNLTNLRSLRIQGYGAIGPHGPTAGGLTGSIPPEIGNLTNLRSLRVDDRSVENVGFKGTTGLTGSIPPEIGNLTNLEELTLVGNQLTGSIPPEIGNLTNLRRLDLSLNQLTGSIPPEIFNLPLQYLDLRSNQLTGSIPPEIGKIGWISGPQGWRSLWELTLSDNQFTGSIPPEIGNLTDLRRLDLGNNRLTGSIPPELGNIGRIITDYEYGNKRYLRTLDLSFNQLTGSIPPELGNLSNYLNLSNNRLTGSIPPELGNFPQYTGERIGLDLSNNRLTGSIPPELDTFVQNGLDLSFNQLTGSIPASLFTPLIDGPETKAWVDLILSFNQLTGSIPPEIGNSPATKWRPLDLRCNQLTGSIPPGLRTVQGKIVEHNMPGIFYAPRLRGNKLTGPAHYELLKPSCIFNDIEGSVHKTNIELIHVWRITYGCGTLPTDRFCPSDTVNRRQMATFLERTLTFLFHSRSYTISDRSITEHSGVIFDPGANPGGAVTRADMAEMLVAAFPSLSAAARSQGLFTDTTGLPDATVRAIEGIHAAGVTTGCATEPLRYCPHKKITRAQMATFLARAVSPALRQ